MSDSMDIWNFALVLVKLGAVVLLGAVVVVLVQRYLRNRLTDPKHDYYRRRHHSQD